jgi:hypothetical protein
MDARVNKAPVLEASFDEVDGEDAAHSHHSGDAAHH